MSEQMPKDPAPDSSQIQKRGFLSSAWNRVKGELQIFAQAVHENSEQVAKAFAFAAAPSVVNGVAAAFGASEGAIIVANAVGLMASAVAASIFRVSDFAGGAAGFGASFIGATNFAGPGIVATGVCAFAAASFARSSIEERPKTFRRVLGGTIGGAVLSAVMAFGAISYAPPQVRAKKDASVSATQLQTAQDVVNKLVNGRG